MSTRREFLKSSALAGGLLATSGLNLFAAQKKMFFDISLAEWSLHRMLFDGKLTNMEFPEFTKNTFRIDAVEYVNAFFFEKARDKQYLSELKQRTDDNGITNVLIMIDREGALGDADEAKRKQAVENHYKWIEAAEYLGCHSIRVNAGGQGSKEEVQKRVVDSLSTLCTFGKEHDINVIVENHGGYSSNGEWLSSTVAAVDMKNCGTLPDFGNFTIDRDNDVKYDRYKGMKELLPYAKGVSAKCYNFNDKGYETTIDFERMLRLVKKAKYKGHIGIEFEGKEMPEVNGVMACKNLMKKLGGKI